MEDFYPEFHPLLSVFYFEMAKTILNAKGVHPQQDISRQTRYSLRMRDSKKQNQIVQNNRYSESYPYISSIDEVFLQNYKAGYEETNTIASETKPQNTEESTYYKA